jgi:hypothetical protein
MKEKHPEKRSWWVDPQGKIYDVGHNHVKFLKEHPKIFGEWADINKALTLNWIRVAYLGYEYVVHCHSITRAQLEACQQIYKSLGGEHKIFISTLNKIGYISHHDFIWADSQIDLLENLFKDQTGIRASVMASQASEWMKAIYPNKRSWWISPYGEVHDAGYDHDQFVKEHPEIFGTNNPKLVKDFGWVRIASYGKEFVVDAKSLSQKGLDEAQSLFSGTGNAAVLINIGDRYAELTRDEFLQADSVPKLMKELRVQGSRKASGDDRAWLISPEGRVYNCGHEHDGPDGCGSNPELFKVAQEIDPDADQNEIAYLLVGDKWTKIGYFVHPGYGGHIVSIESYFLSSSIFSKVQEILSSLNIMDNTTVVLFVDGKTNKLQWKDFKFFDSMQDVNKFLWHNRSDILSMSRSSDVRRMPVIVSKRMASQTDWSSQPAWVEDRAWFVSPEGKILSCGRDHKDCVEKNRDALQDMGYENIESYDILVDDGWAKIGRSGPAHADYLYIECKRLTPKYFEILHNMAMQQSTQMVSIDEEGSNLVDLDRKEFLELSNLFDLRRRLRFRGRTSSLPKSRNFLIGVSLDDMSWPLRQAFDLLNLSEKKDKLSANQVATIFQANDEFLQDHVNRTSTELIQDLNAFFQYGPQEQTAR